MQSSCLELRGSEAQDNFGKYIENLMSELCRASAQKKPKVTHGHFQHNDKFKVEDYYMLESNNEICFDMISLKLSVKLISLVENQLKKAVHKLDSSESDDDYINKNRDDIKFSSTFDDNFEEVFLPIFEKCLESKNKGLSVNSQFKLLILGGNEELQIIVHNLAIIFEEQYKKLFDLDIRLYIYPMKDSDLSYYIASKDSWYQKHVYFSACRDLYAPYIGTLKNSDKEMKKILGNIQTEHKYEQGNGDEDELDDNPFYGFLDIMKNKSLQHYLQCANNLFQVYVYRLDCFEKKPNFELVNIKLKPQASFYFTSSVIFGEQPMKKLIEKYSDINLAPPDYHEIIEEETTNEQKGQSCQHSKIIFKPYVYDLDISDKRKIFKNDFRHIGIYNVKPKNDPIWCNSEVNPSKWPLRFNT